MNVQDKMGAEKYLRKKLLPLHWMLCSKLSNHIYVEKIPEQCCLGRPNCKGVQWNKHSSSGLDEQQVEGQDHSKRDI